MRSPEKMRPNVKDLTQQKQAKNRYLKGNNKNCEEKALTKGNLV